MFSLQLHHHRYIIKLTSITSFHFNYIICFNLITSSSSITSYTFILSHYDSRIPSISSVTIYVRISTGTQFPHSAPTFLLPFHIFVPFSISNDIWDTSKLLLLSSNVETNLGVRPIDENLFFCSIWSSNINQGINKIWVLRVQRLTARCHQACNGLTTNQTHHTKSSRCTNMWKWPQDGTGIAEIITPPPSVFELPNRTYAAGKLCSVCNNPIRSCYADLTL